ncbi:uncharacterized protein LOC135942176 isoform X1 [Cloeon dipterum]|uniref:uncharacterized protein LOC135942176 isoform X1 n=2 Tax=Cloeon dipterum TaxID=197152 RepID=UPI0032206F91
MKRSTKGLEFKPPDAGMDSDDGEPAHHARRPMNAFLIFCKRHRSVVREKYPTLENRCITKILGEWWAQLEPQEKSCYTDLAKKYKEAFLEANPDFKWYKLPAPPLRTLVTRPSNQKPPKLEYPSASGPIVPGKLADESQMGGLSSLLSSPPVTPTSPTVPKPPKKRYLEESLGSATPLSSWEGTSFDKTDDNSRDSSPDSEGKDSGLCNLSPTTVGAATAQAPLVLNQAWSQLGAKAGPSAAVSMKTSETVEKNEEDMCVSLETPAAAPSSWADVASRETNNNEASYLNDFSVHAEEDEKPNVADTSSKSSGPWIQLKESSRSDMPSQDAFYEKNLKGKGSHDTRKSVRACKGKRYQEFMSSGRIATGKRGRLRMYKSFDSDGPSKVRHNSGSSSASEKTDSAYSEASRGSRDPNEETLYVLQGKSTPTPSMEMDMDLELSSIKRRHISECSEDSEMDANMKKRFRAADFNLDEKIDALPSLSLEEFQQKKKAKKKRASSAPSTPKKHIVRDRSLETTPVSKPTANPSSVTPTKNPPLVGSQKRKARRLQITRVEPNSPHVISDNAVADPNNVLMSNSGLATLAAVASVTKRLFKQ